MTSYTTSVQSKPIRVIESGSSGAAAQVNFQFPSPRPTPILLPKAKSSVEGDEVIETLEPKLRALFGYWDGKRGGRVMPARPDIDPIEIPDLLPNLMLVATADRVEDFCFRLFGTEATKGFGQDRTGMRIAELQGIENLNEVLNGYWLTYSEMTPQYFQGRTVSSAKDHVQYSRLTLPLSADGERVDMILGGFVFFAAE